MSGNNVSHAHNKTRRRYLPNIQRVSIFSEVLNRPIRLKVSASAIRTVEHAGGLDKFLADAKEANLSANARRVRREILKAQAAS
jgi:large subunit ribosomal protein L28